MLKLFKILFYNLLILGNIMTMTSYSWFSMWMGLEISLISVIPILLNPENPQSTEASMKYFISQTIASSTILFSLSLMSLNNKMMMENSTLSMIMNSMLMMKLGAAPLHFWFPQVVSGLSWENCLIILTILKTPPLVVIMNNKPSTHLMMIFIISSMFIGTISSLNQSNLRKILSYSSINHISWMISSTMTSIQNMWIYFMIYSLNSFNICYLMKSMNLNHISQLINLNKPIKSTLMMNFVSMGGLPPFAGFFPKWMIISKLTQINMSLLALLLILSSLIMMFVYIQMFFSILLISNSIKKPFNPKNHMKSLIISSSSLNLALIAFTIFNETA